MKLHLKKLAPAVPVIFVILQASVHPLLQPSPKKQICALHSRNSDTDQVRNRWIKESDYSLRFPPQKLIDRDFKTPDIIPKKRSRISLDVGSNLEEGQRVDRDDSSGWDIIKDAAYNSIESLSAIGGALQSRKTLRKQVVLNGYSDTVEQPIKSSPSLRSALELQQEDLSRIDTMMILTPGAKLLKQYEQSLQSKSPSLSSPNNVDDVQSRTTNILGSVKDFVYDTLDMIPRRKIKQQTQSSSMDSSFKVVTRTSINKDETVQSLSPVLPGLKSPNLLSRLQAYASLVTSERKQKRRLLQQKTEIQLEQAKENIYSTMDGIKKIGETVGNLPVQCDQFLGDLEDTMVETNQNLQIIVQDITSVPEKIQSAVKSVKDAAEETVRITTVVAQDIQNIPATIQENIDQASMNIVRTKENIDQTIQKLQDVTFEAKVLVGLEKPKPSPPPPRPISLPKSNQQLALETAGIVLSSLGKVAWFLGKGIVTVGITASKIGWSIYMDSIKREEKRLMNDPKTQTVSDTQLDVPEIPARNEPMSLAQIDPNLDREVADALRLASVAINQSAEIEKRKKKDALVAELELALANAKLAAAQAVSDAAELEKIVKKR